MACIVCLATIAAIGFGASVIAEEVLTRRLERLAKMGGITRETSSVATWQGEFNTVLDSGESKVVPVTIQLFKDGGRVRIQVDDHDLTQAEAERLEDEIMDALDAEPVERRYPSDDTGGIHADHDHDEVELEEELVEISRREAAPEKR